MKRNKPKERYACATIFFSGNYGCLMFDEIASSHLTPHDAERLGEYFEYDGRTENSKVFRIRWFQGGDSTQEDLEEFSNFCGTALTKCGFSWQPNEEPDADLHDQIFYFKLTDFKRGTL